MVLMSSQSKYLELCNKAFGRLALRTFAENQEVRHSLLEAHITMLPDEYGAFTFMTSLLIGAASAGLSVPLGLLLMRPPIMALLFLPISFAMGLAAYFVLLAYPKSRAKERAKDIDAKLPYAANFIAALSAGGKTADVVFREMAKQEIYGEFQKETLWLYRDITVLGKDTLGAIRDASARCPSEKCRDFFQGIVTVINSGGELKPYFSSRAEQYMRENRADQRNFIESVGMIAESFITMGVAGVLFLIVAISTMAMLSSSIQGSMALLYIIVLVMLPVVHAGFIFVIKNMSKEA